MARESAKRASRARVDRGRTNRGERGERPKRGERNEGASAKSGRGRGTPKRSPSDVLPPERAPARGKYDRTRSADERHKEQLDRLLDAAGYVFAEKGWADATVEAIVSRAGMSRRTFYEHFDDLRDCLFIFHEKATRRAFRAVELTVQNEESHPMRRLRQGVMGFLGGIGTFPHVARVIFRVVRAAGPEFEAAHEQMMNRFARLVYDGVASAHAIGRTELPPDDLRVFALVSAMESVAMRYVLRGEESKAMDAAPVLIDMMQRTFGAIKTPEDS